VVEVISSPKWHFCQQDSWQPPRVDTSTIDQIWLGIWKHWRY